MQNKQTCFGMTLLAHTQALFTAQWQCLCLNRDIRYVTSAPVLKIKRKLNIMFFGYFDPEKDQLIFRGGRTNISAEKYHCMSPRNLFIFTMKNQYFWIKLFQKSLI